jgi:protein ImuB
VAADVPAAVVRANEIVASSAAARDAGVLPGLRRREAQARCPGITLLPDDPARDARAFEPVVAAVESVIPAVAVLNPGVCAAGARGATRYFGGEQPLASRVVQAVRDACGVVCLVGIADGPFAAGLAARDGRLVRPGGTRRFLAPWPVEVLDQPELADLLRRLGLPSLGHLADLPAADVLARFGPDGALAHRRALGEELRLPDARQPPPDLAVQTELDPPAERVEHAVFAVKGLAEQLHELLRARGLACTRLAVEAQTEHGEQLRRVWRHDGPLGPAAIADRVRWQLDGWLSGTAGPAGTVERPTAGVMLVRLVPDEIVRWDGHQLGLWGGTGDGARRVARSLARVQGILGPDAVVTPVLRGGRGPAERVRLVPWGEPREDQPDGLWDEPRDAARAGHGGRQAPGRPRPAGRVRRKDGDEGDPTWPGRLPEPAPATVLPEPLPAVVEDADGVPVGVTGRHMVTAPPARLSVDGRPAVAVTAWAGPWPVDERWWEPAGARRRARFQLATATGPAWLLAVEGGRWWVEAVYD